MENTRVEKQNQSGSAAQEDDSGHMLGENGTRIQGSITTGRNGKTERVDVENPEPGQRKGDVHYHDAKNTKWRYDVDTGKLIDPDSHEPAPPFIQRVRQAEWFKKAIEKALHWLGEI